MQGYLNKGQKRTVQFGPALLNYVGETNQRGEATGKGIATNEDCTISLEGNWLENNPIGVCKFLFVFHVFVITLILVKQRGHDYTLIQEMFYGRFGK